MGYKSWIGIVAVLILLVGAYMYLERPAPKQSPTIMHLDNMTQVVLRSAWPALLATAAQPPLGNPKAPWTMIEIGDFQCPMCARMHSDVQDFAKQSDGAMKLYFVNWPLPMHAHAFRAATAADAAARQHKFWAMYNAIYASRDALENATGPAAETVLAQDAGKASLDQARFVKDMADPSLAVAINNQIALVRSTGAMSTPTFLLRKSGSPTIYFFVGQAGQEETAETPKYPGFNDLIDQCPWQGGTLDLPPDSSQMSSGPIGPAPSTDTKTTDTVGNSIKP